MAQLMTSKAIAIVLAVGVYFAAVSAQEFESAAPAPAPTMDKGAAYSFGISGAVICSSLVLSMLAFFKH